MPTLRRAPKRGEVIDLPYGSGVEPLWWVRTVTVRGGLAFVVLEHLLDQDLVCHLVLVLRARDTA